LPVDFILVLPPKQSVVLLHDLVGVVFLSVISGKLVLVLHKCAALCVLDWAYVCFTLGVNFINFLFALVCRYWFDAIVSRVLILDLGAESIRLCCLWRNAARHYYFLVALHRIQDIRLLADSATVSECIISACNAI